MTRIGKARRWLNEHIDYEGDDCLPWPFATNGSGKPTATHNGRAQPTRRVICELKYGPAPENKPFAEQTCEGPVTCCNPNHTRWSDSIRNKGERHWAAKFSDQDIANIREAIRCGKSSPQDLAEQYSVCEQTINKINQRKLWKHVSDDNALNGDHQNTPEIDSKGC